MSYLFDVAEMIEDIDKNHLLSLITRIARNASVEHLVKPRILDVLGIPSLELADIHQLEGVLSMLQTLTLYEGRPSSRLSVSPPLSTLPDPLAAKR